MAEVSRAADAKRLRRRGILNEEGCVHGSGHARGRFHILRMDNGCVPVSMLSFDCGGDGRIHVTNANHGNEWHHLLFSDKRMILVCFAE